MCAGLQGTQVRAQAQHAAKARSAMLQRHKVRQRCTSTRPQLGQSLADASHTALEVKMAECGQK